MNPPLLIIEWDYDRLWFVCLLEISFVFAIKTIQCQDGGPKAKLACHQRHRLLELVQNLKNFTQN